MGVFMHTHTKHTVFIIILVFIIVALLFFSGCSTLPTDVQFTTELSSQYTSLQELTVQTTIIRLKADSKNAIQIQKDIQKAIKNSQSESVLLASLYALLGQMQTVSGDKKSAELSLKQARAYNPGCEDSFILEMLLQNDISDKIKIVTQGITKADTSQRLRCELGILFFNTGNYADALAQFDSAIPFMPESLASLYLPIRDKTHEYLQAGVKPNQIISDKFTLEKMILITNSETSLLVWFTGIERCDTGVLFERMKGSGWFPDNPLNPNVLVRQKDAALFFWYIITKGDSRKLYKYTEKYKVQKKSPIEDVPYDSPWFNAVMGIVEEDILKLKDGKFFEPDAVMTEIEFRKALQAVTNSI